MFSDKIRNSIQHLRWVKSLPLEYALRIAMMKICRRICRLPIFFSFAQGAEDIILSHIFQHKIGKSGPGFYVDVGCNLPIRFSNTFELYLSGWHGICIDANLEIIEEFKRVRKYDIAICAAVSDIEREVTFYRSTTPDVSTIDERQIIEWRKHFDFPSSLEERITTCTLTSILQQQIDSSTEIDLLSVDVEGHDLQVLNGLDFECYRPKVIVIEMRGLQGIENTEIYNFLTKRGYCLLYFSILSAYFVDKKYLNKN